MPWQQWSRQMRSSLKLGGGVSHRGGRGRGLASPQRTQACGAGGGGDTTRHDPPLQVSCPPRGDITSRGDVIPVRDGAFPPPPPQTGPNGETEAAAGEPATRGGAGKGVCLSRHATAPVACRDRAELGGGEWGGESAPAPPPPTWHVGIWRPVATRGRAERVGRAARGTRRCGGRGGEAHTCASGCTGL